MWARRRDVAICACVVLRWLTARGEEEEGEETGETGRGERGRRGLVDW